MEALPGTVTTLLTLTLWQMSIKPETLAALKDACDCKAVLVTFTPPSRLGMGSHRYMLYWRAPAATSAGAAARPY